LGAKRPGGELTKKRNVHKSSMVHETDRRQTNDSINKQESHAVAEKPRDAAVNSDRYQQPVGQKQSE